MKLETLTKVKHGDWTPPGHPYVPVGNFHDINIAMDNIKELFPHTGKRMTKETFRHYLVNKNIQKDFEEKIEPELIKMQEATHQDLKEPTGYLTPRIVTKFKKKESKESTQLEEIREDAVFNDPKLK
jgi:hypothetical protein